MAAEGMVTGAQMAEVIASAGRELENRLTTQTAQLVGRVDVSMFELGMRVSDLEENTTAVVANIKRESGSFAARLAAAESDIANALERSEVHASAQLEDLNARAVSISADGATLEKRIAEGTAKLEKLSASGERAWGPADFLHLHQIHLSSLYFLRKSSLIY